MLSNPKQDPVSNLNCSASLKSKKNFLETTGTAKKNYLLILIVIFLA